MVMTCFCRAVCRGHYRYLCHVGSYPVARMPGDPNKAVYEEEQRGYYILSSFWAELDKDQVLGEPVVVQTFDMHTCTLEDVQVNEKSLQECLSGCMSPLLRSVSGLLLLLTARGNNVGLCPLLPRRSPLTPSHLRALGECNQYLALHGRLRLNAGRR